MPTIWEDFSETPFSQETQDSVRLELIPVQKSLVNPTCGVGIFSFGGFRVDEFHWWHHQLCTAHHRDFLLLLLQ